MSGSLLVAVDGSEHSTRVVDLACELAGARGVPIDLVHVIPPGSLPSGLERWAATEHVDAPSALYEQAIGDNIVGGAALRAREHGREVGKRHVLHGDPAREIVALANDEAVDTLLIGTRGLSDLQGLVIGSVAHKVCHAAPCTVIVVR